MSLRERFVDFFEDSNPGDSPYPWQRALVEEVGSSGRWPDITAPTGSGKSAVIDAHVFLVAEHAAGRLPVRPPPRLVLVAPRRVLVDDQFERASRLADRLSEAAAGDCGSPLAEAAAALEGLRASKSPGDQPRPLQAWSLRGGVLLDNGWRLEPAACQVICATPQMWGSRLLLRGYGATRASRNLEAGLLGHDAVAIIDEAHLHRRLVETARVIASKAVGSTGLQVVAMSATQAAAEGQVGLLDADFDDPELSRRVKAAKAIRLVEAEQWEGDMERVLVDEARGASAAGTVGVFVNDVRSALSVAAALRGHGHTVELVCGRLRSADVARLRSDRPCLLTPEGDPEVEFLVSTQSLEVGVDLDLPAMVTMIASATALAQRAGRLNRSGRLSESTLVVVMPKALEEQGSAAIQHAGPYTAEDLIAAVRWLRELDGSISPAVVTRSLLPLPARPVLPKLRWTDLQTLAMTSDAQAADPDPELYLQDPQAELPEVSVIARRHLELDRSVVRAALVACPPRQHELAPLRLGRTLDRVIEVVSDRAWVVRVDDGSLAALRLAEAGSLRSGDTMVVPDAAMICTAGVVGLGERRSSAEPLHDVLEEAPPGTAQDRIVALSASEVASIVATDPILGTRAGRESLAEVLDRAGIEELGARLRRHRRLSELELVWCGDDGDVETGLLVIRDMAHRAEQVTLVAAAELVSIDQHELAVRDRMDVLIGALGVDSDQLPAQQLLLAAQTHDEGKRHRRFQRRMGADDLPLAKPRPGHVPDRGDGWRHEQLSAAYAAEASGGDALVVSLVGAHHGRGRMLFDRGAADLLDGWPESPPPVADWTSKLFGPMGEYELMRTEAQERCGVHGLAWLEALLRCADMQVSREGS